MKTETSESKLLLELPAWASSLIAMHVDFNEFVAQDGHDASSVFHIRCRESAEVARDLAVMRHAQESFAFTPVPLTEHFKALARIADVPSARIFTHFNISGHEVSDVIKMARLAAQLGIVLRNALLHLRIGIASTLAPSELALLTAHTRSGPGGRVGLGAIEDRLSAIESDFSPGTRSHLRQVEAVFLSSYEHSQ